MRNTINVGDVLILHPDKTEYRVERISFVVLSCWVCMVYLRNRVTGEVTSYPIDMIVDSLNMAVLYPPESANFAEGLWESRRRKKERENDESR